MKDFYEKLSDWYLENQRELPWREDPTPYHVWLSEIMLQQTRVEAAREYYLRFLNRLPDVRSLAEASEDTCLKLWEGLGYYSRVRNMKRAASEVMEKFGGNIPNTSAELIRLPGIGQYTSAAIASIAFGERIPAVDGNLLRIYSRLEMYEENIRTPAAFKKALEYYTDRMPKNTTKTGKGNPCGNFNQALMDLGNAVCLPNTAPECGNCPISEFCRTHRERPGMEADLPVIPAGKGKKEEHLTVFLIRSEGRTAVRKRPARGLLAGLYEFPSAAGELETEDAVKWLREHSVEPIRIKKIIDAEHIFTHKKWIMRGYEVTMDSFSEGNVPFIMASEEEIAQKYCIPSAFGAYLKWMDLKKNARMFAYLSRYGIILRR